MDTEQRIRERIDIFIRDLQGLLIEAAKESLVAALEGGAGATRASRRAPAAQAAPRGRRGPRGRVRRSSEQLAQVQEQIVSLLGTNPGLTSEEIQEALGVEKKDIQRPLTLLRSEKRIKTRGQRRGMKYYAN